MSQMPLQINVIVKDGVTYDRVGDGNIWRSRSDGRLYRLSPDGRMEPIIDVRPPAAPTLGGWWQFGVALGLLYLVMTYTSWGVEVGIIILVGMLLNAEGVGRGIGQLLDWIQSLA